MEFRHGRDGYFPSARCRQNGLPSEIRGGHGNCRRAFPGHSRQSYLVEWKLECRFGEHVAIQRGDDRAFGRRECCRASHRLVSRQGGCLGGFCCDSIVQRTCGDGRRTCPRRERHIRQQRTARFRTRVGRRKRGVRDRRADDMVSRDIRRREREGVRRRGRLRGAEHVQRRPHGRRGRPRQDHCPGHVGRRIWRSEIQWPFHGGRDGGVRRRGRHGELLRLLVLLPLPCRNRHRRIWRGISFVRGGQSAGQPASEVHNAHGRCDGQVGRRMGPCPVHLRRGANRSRRAHAVHRGHERFPSGKHGNLRRWHDRGWRRGHAQGGRESLGKQQSHMQHKGRRRAVRR